MNNRIKIPLKSIVFEHFRQVLRFGVFSRQSDQDLFFFSGGSEGGSEPVNIRIHNSGFQAWSYGTLSEDEGNLDPQGLFAFIFVS